MSTEPRIERLNYFNGQRLEAADFRLEQGYHLGVRRWLNRSLFTAGIATGLEVVVKTGDPHTVIVEPGLALDAQGREIIVVAPVEIGVTGRPSNPGDPVIGNYLVIEYAEEAVAPVIDGCAVQLGTAVRAREDLTWGDPARILAAPRLSWQHRWPPPAENRIVLAQVELDATCAVRDIRTFVRKYVGASKPPQAQALALEGEKDIDATNPKQLFFEVTGGAPARASLFLRGARFSTLFYTEVGQHQHAMEFNTSDAGAAGPHSHKLELGELRTTDNGAHRHEIKAAIVDYEGHFGFEMDSGGEIFPLTGPGGVHGGRAQMEVHESGVHSHTLQGGSKQTDAAGALPMHQHLVKGATLAAGQEVPVRTGPTYSFAKDLRIAFDGKDVTPEVIQQLRDRDGPATWPMMGDGNGTPGDKLNARDSNGKIDGTGEIDLLRVGKVDLTPGTHWITLSVPAGGGKVLYNLYLG